MLAQTVRLLADHDASTTQAAGGSSTETASSRPARGRSRGLVTAWISMPSQRAAISTLAPRSRMKVMVPGRRSEEHTSELQSLMRSSYADFCLKKKLHTDTICQS